MATVANTAANISGDTLLTAENNDTVTGLKTFDRDPSAPFAVSASSAVVPNLDADKVDGQDITPWTTFVATFTNMSLGNGTQSCKYFQIGKLVIARYQIAFGSTSSITGIIRLSVPVTATGASGIAMGGVGEMIDSGTAAYLVFGQLFDTTTWVPQIANTSSTYAISNQITTGVPFTPGANDSLQIEIIYEAS